MSAALVEHDHLGRRRGRRGAREIVFITGGDDVERFLFEDEGEEPSEVFSKFLESLVIRIILFCMTVTVMVVFL